MIFSRLYKENDNCNALLGHLECRLSSGPEVQSHGQVGQGRWQSSDSCHHRRDGSPRGSPSATWTRRQRPRADPAGRTPGPAQPRWKRSAQAPAERSRGLRPGPAALPRYRPPHPRSSSGASGPATPPPSPSRRRGPRQ